MSASELANDADAALMAAIVEGDRQALARLYDRYSGAMFGVGLRILHLRPEAEDLLHDVFLEAWDHAADYDRARGSVRAWLLLRMRSRAIDRRRRNQRSVALSAVAEPVAAEPDWTTADGRTVRSALHALPPAMWRLLELAFFAGQSSTQIAASLGCPVGTVKSRLRAAVGALRRLFPPQASPHAASLLEA